MFEPYIFGDEILSFDELGIAFGVGVVVMGYLYCFPYEGSLVFICRNLDNKWNTLISMIPDINFWF